MGIEKKLKELIGDEPSSEEELEDLFMNDDEYENIKKEFGIDLKEIEKQFEDYSPIKDLHYVRMTEDTVHPKYAYPTDSGFDLHSIEEVTIPSLGRALVGTGLKIDIIENYEIQIRPKSGLALKLGLTVLNTPGTVDQGYNGEIKVIVFNASSEVIKIEKGMKIAQAVLCPVVCGKHLNPVEKNEITNKDRNESGFGSTGI